MDEKGNATFSVGDTINPNEFDVSVSALLIGLGGEKYIDIFRENNIGQSTLIELTNEDLIKLGIDDAGIRKKLLDEVKNLPVYTEIIENIPSKPNLDPKEVINVLEESSQHLYRIYLSMMTNTLALKNSKAVDCLINDELFASKVALSSLRQMTETLNVMDIALHTQFKAVSKESKHRRRKKVVVGTLGGVVIAVLGKLHEYYPAQKSTCKKLQFEVRHYRCGNSSRSMVTIETLSFYGRIDKVTDNGYPPFCR